MILKQAHSARESQGVFLEPVWEQPVSHQTQTSALEALWTLRQEIHVTPDEDLKVIHLWDLWAWLQDNFYPSNSWF